MQKIQLSDHFTYKKLLQFTLPSIVMMVFTSVYGVVDGFFVSNFAGQDAFVAVNFIWPFLMLLGAFGFMFGAGGSALVAKTLGEGDNERANRLFSLFVYVSIALGVVIAAIGIAVLRPVTILLGADTELLIENCVAYGVIILIALPAYMLQIEFQSFFVTAEKPTLGLIFTLASGLTNIVLDALFVAIFQWGIMGAAAATAISQAVGGIGPLFYFFSKNKSLLRLTKTKFDGKALFQACSNGSSELLSNVSMSLVGMLYNAQLMKYADQDGVSAYGVLMYVSMIFISIFIGYSVGTAPVVGYHYGARHDQELKSLRKKSILLVGLTSICMLLLAETLAIPLSLIFVRDDPELLALTQRAFFIYSFSFLFAGVSIYGSSFFTALNNGPISALLSFLRTVIFQVAAVMLLPIKLDTDGIWLSVVVAEALAAIVTVICFFVLRKKYKY